MCDTCPAHIPGPGEVTSSALGLAVGAALTRNGRRVMFWGLAIPFAIGIVVTTLGWWLLPIALGVLALAAGAWVAVRRLARHALVVAPPSLQHRVALPAAQRRRAITREQRALPAAAKALPGAVVTGQVVPAPVHGKVVR